VTETILLSFASCPVVMRFDADHIGIVWNAKLVAAHNPQITEPVGHPWHVMPLALDPVAGEAETADLLHLTPDIYGEDDIRSEKEDNSSLFDAVEIL
jgi:hypothetical protein